MKQLHKTRIGILLMLCFLAISLCVSAQDSSAAEPSVNLRYFVNNNNIQYLLVQTRIKMGKKFQPLPRQVVKLFLDSNSAENLITKTYTDENGKAKIIIQPTLKDKWMNSPKHIFIGVLEATSLEDERTTKLEITKAKIELDTSTVDGTRTVNVKVMFFENNAWVPAKDVEMKVGVDRLGGILSVGDKETYTTDSTGTVSAEFKRDSLLGDQHGNFVLVAKVEEEEGQEKYGNLLVEKTVPWGVAVKQDNSFFNQRTLWSTRLRTPFWLLFMAYSIVIGVWGTIIYLVLLMVKIKKLGTAVVETIDT